jgi:hypothetical protein
MNRGAGSVPLLFPYAAAFGGDDKDHDPHQSLDQEKEETGYADLFEPGFQFRFLRCFGHSGTFWNVKVGNPCISALFPKGFLTK